MRHTLVILPTLLILACDNSRHASVELETWAIQPAPLVQIGALDGQEPYLLHAVQDVVTFSDGRIGIANGGSQDIRIYSPGGEYLWSTGRRGDGPGEFRSIASIDVIAADSIVAFDPGLQRVSVFDSEGVYARSWNVESPGRGYFPSKARALEDGTVLVAFLRGRMPGDPPGLFRQSAPVLRYSSDGDELGIVAQLPGEEWYYSAEQGVLTVLPLGGGSHFATAGDRVFIGDGRELAIYTARGDHLQTLHPLETRAVTQKDIDAEATRRLANVPSDQHARIRALLAELPYPDSLPGYTDLAGGGGGHVWLKLYTAPAGQASAWMIMTQHGEPVATLELPPGYIPYRVLESRVIGVLRDSDDVEYVVAYSVVDQS